MHGQTAAAPTFRARAKQLEKTPPCQVQCPNSGDIRGWLGIIAQHEKNGLTLDDAYDKAWERLAEFNPLPASIGRICPHPCEDLCSRTDKDGAVSINAMERFLGDWAVSRALPLPRLTLQQNLESVGVIGSGPASLSFAYQMARRGYAVTIYEKDDLPGGMLRHAIPDYRLPRDVLDAEIERVLALGIELVRGTDVGKSIDLGEIRERHALTFLGVGAQAAKRLGIPGEDGPGVLAGIDYLQYRKEHLDPQPAQHVLVIGGGNTAIDAARCAVRDGAEVSLLYRRSEAEMPAIAAEVEDARAEGVDFQFLVAPTRILRDNGTVRFVEVQTMRLGEPDEAGRRRPVPVPGSRQKLAADLVIVAVSQAPDLCGMDELASVHDLLHPREDGKLGDDIWAGGDDRGIGIASKAVAQGRLAAESAHAELRGLARPIEQSSGRALPDGAVNADYYADRDRAELSRNCPEERLANPDAEVDRTLSYTQAHEEAARCMSCGLCFGCQMCFMYCNATGFSRIEQTRPGNYFVMSLDACEGCGKCIEICPCGYLEPRDL
jgi:formate dehydrogenase major subunit